MPHIECGKRSFCGCSGSIWDIRSGTGWDFFSIIPLDGTRARVVAVTTFLSIFQSPKTALDGFFKNRYISLWILYFRALFLCRVLLPEVSEQNFCLRRRQ